MPEPTLVDYLKIIKKHRLKVLWVLIVVAGTVTILSILGAKTFESEAILKIGQVQGDFIESPAEMSEIFQNDSVRSELRAILNLKNLPARKKIVVQQMKTEDKGDFIPGFIKIIGQEQNPEQALKLTQAATKFLIKRHQEILKQKEAFLEQKISQEKENLTLLQKELEKTEHRIKALSPYAEAQSRALGAYLNFKSELQERITETQRRLIDYSLQKSKNYPTKVFSTPRLPAKSSSRFVPNLIMGIVLGIFLGLVWAFSAEWWEKNKKRLRS